ncbi:MAG: hypothetical protein KGI80_05580 [Verrucomicrobiota bacterium]|nr:hypothetical protein [Verrucomicrobiota bacterium]
MKYLLLLLPLFLSATEDDFSDSPINNGIDDFIEELTLEPSVTEHSYSCGGVTFDYQAVAGICPILAGTGEKIASFFYVAYFAKEGDSEERPITFIFPGGPGGSCAAEILSTVGPRRLQFPKEGKRLLPPYRIIDNPQTLLRETDLVFIDPAAVGYSKVHPTAEGLICSELFSTEGDIVALGQFIHNFLSNYERWNSPKYLAGISYGGFRSLGLAQHLLNYDISLHGLVLLSPVIDYATVLSQNNQFLADALFLPTCAATAWHYKRLWPDRPLTEVVEHAKRFCYDAYLPSLLQPKRLTASSRKTLYQEIAKLSGLDEEVIHRYSGRLCEEDYTKEFFLKERRRLGGLDTRYSSDWGNRGEWEIDPSYQDMQGLASAFRHYLKKELNLFAPLMQYIIFNYLPWDFRTYDSYAWPDFVQRLQRTLIYNPEMKLFVGCGYYDCRTPFSATEYCLDHLDIPASYRNNICMTYYPAGHGFVFDLPSLKKLQNDLRSFLAPK